MSACTIQARNMGPRVQGKTIDQLQMKTPHPLINFQSGLFGREAKNCGFHFSLFDHQPPPPPFLLFFGIS